MEFEYSYKGSSQVSDRADRTDMSFSPDTSREPTFFRGQLARQIPFREAISALHQVVVSDLRWKPKDRTAYREWLASQEQIDWAHVARQRGDVAREIESIQAELRELAHRHEQRWRGFYKARQAYFDYLYQKDRDAWFVLDPVITVHPDEIFFECFSQDESSYGRLGTSYEVYEQIGEFACGTTNIDYSQALYDEFQKIRSYKSTSLEVDPSGFEVKTTHEDAFKEVKIDLPDSWVRGFLQVSSAMSLAATRFDLHPMDVHNICFVLRRHRELKGPRSMRYRLSPGRPVKVVFEPWNIELDCPRSVYEGDHEREIRIWGRRRIHILERLIPIAQRFTVYLLGTGMPSFYVADLGHMTFTLGLSGWTANDWSTAGNFDLMAPRADVDDMTRRRVFEALKETWVESPDSLAARLGLDRSVVLGALAGYTQAGRAIYDLDKQVYRVRELSREPLPMDRLRFASEREAAASQLVRESRVRVSARLLAAGAIELCGVISHGNKSFGPELVIDGDERLVKAECSCNFYQQNKLYKGPCEHMLAARMVFARDRDAAVVTGAGAGTGNGIKAGEKDGAGDDAGASGASGARATADAGDNQGGSQNGNQGGVLRQLFDRLTGRERQRPQSAQLVDLALERAMRELIDRGLVDIATRRRDRLIEEMLAATFRAHDLESAVDLALAALLASDLPEEIYGEDDDLRGVLIEAFESVQRTAADDQAGHE